MGELYPRSYTEGYRFAEFRPGAFLAYQRRYQR